MSSINGLMALPKSDVFNIIMFLDKAQIIKTKDIYNDTFIALFIFDSLDDVFRAFFGFNVCASNIFT